MEKSGTIRLASASLKGAVLYSINLGKMQVMLPSVLAHSSPPVPAAHGGQLQLRMCQPVGPDVTNNIVFTSLCNYI